ncbi:MAG: hypothetical protein OHK0015_03460 [Chloroflexi bacterium OHK40]
MRTSFAPAADLLGQSAPLDEVLEVPLLGVPVVYRSNSAAVIATAASAFQRWRQLPPALIDAGPAARVDVVVHLPGSAGLPLAHDERFVFRAHGRTFLAAAGASVLTAQLDHGYALAFVTPALAADEASLRRNVLECLGFLLVNMRDRTPVHAAGVVRNGRAVLLVGASMAGKSTLCYACVRAGFSLLAEDTVCVSLARGLRVWGHPGPIHLLPDAPRFFPELAGIEPRMLANGKLKLTVDVSALGSERLVTHAERVALCFVERSSGQASRLEPLPAVEAAAALSDPREPGFDLLRDQAPTVAAALAASGAYRLRVGSDPGTAVTLLKHLTDS